MKQRVLIVHNYYKIPGGEDTVVANERKLLEEHGHQVFVYTRSNAEMEQYSILRRLTLPFTTVFNIRTYREIKRIIHREHIDIVHVHNTLNLISPSVYYAAVKCKVPVVQTIHNFRLQCMAAVFYRDGHICEDCISGGIMCALKHSCYRGSKIQTLACILTNWVHRRTGIYQKISYICLTEFNKAKLLQWNEKGRKILDAKQIYIKPNFTFPPSNERYRCETTDEYYLFVGRIEKIKGLDILLDAFKQLPNRHLKIAGTGTDYEYYEKSVKDCSNIEFIGYREREVLWQVIKGAKAVIVASQWYETFGMVIVEAYACGKPVIVGNIGNIADLVDEQQTGVLFEYNNSQALKTAIESFETMNIGQMSVCAYKKYQMEFSPEINYKLLKGIYDNETRTITS